MENLVAVAPSVIAIAQFAKKEKIMSRNKNIDFDINAELIQRGGRTFLSFNNQEFDVGRFLPSDFVEDFAALCEGDDTQECFLSVETSVSPAYPARGPSYASGGEPAEPAEVEVYAMDLYFDDMLVMDMLPFFESKPSSQWLDFVEELAVNESEDY